MPCMATQITTTYLSQKELIWDDVNKNFLWNHGVIAASNINWNKQQRAEGIKNRSVIHVCIYCYAYAYVEHKTLLISVVACGCTFTQHNEVIYAAWNHQLDQLTWLTWHWDWLSKRNWPISVGINSFLFHWESFQFCEDLMQPKARAANKPAF